MFPSVSVCGYKIHFVGKRSQGCNSVTFFTLAQNIVYIHPALDLRRNWMPAAGFPTNSIRDTPARNTDHMNCIHIKIYFTWYHVYQPTLTKTNSHPRQASNEGVSNVIQRQVLAHFLTTKAWIQSRTKQDGTSNKKRPWCRLHLYNFHVLPQRSIPYIIRGGKNKRIWGRTNNWPAPLPTPTTSEIRNSFIHSFIHLAVCLTTGPKPLPKRAVHMARFKYSFLLQMRVPSPFLKIIQ
jgi:hypothetical protein